MAVHKLILDDDLEESFVLIAIHCSEEPFKLAYYLNKQVGLHLTRRDVDLELNNNGLDITFVMYTYDDMLNYKLYDLVSNKCKSLTAQLASSGGLFDNDITDQTIITYLIPESKKVDYYLKVQTDNQTTGLRNLLLQINEIKQVISAYEVNADTLKSRNNLIFD